jgi:hypothetical protein
MAIKTTPADASRVFQVKVRDKKKFAQGDVQDGVRS